MEGHGLKGHFLGIEGNEKSAIVLIPVPFDKTSTYGKGSDKGPAALIEASRNLETYDIDTDSEVYHKGILTDLSVIAKTSQSLQNQLYTRVKGWLQKGKFVGVIGGEHAISQAPIRAHAEREKELTILQLDAHADLYPEYEGNPYSHASVMARVLEFPNVKIVSVGIRSLAKEELKLLKKTRSFFAKDLKGEWIPQVLKALKGPVYITFDLDAFDSSIMPSTGTPEPGGLQWNDAIELLQAVAKKCKVVGFDVVELCPISSNRAPDYLSAKLVYKLLSEVIQ